MFKVQIFNQIAKSGLEVLKKNQIIESNDWSDAILLRSEKLHDFQFPKTVKAVVRAGAGVNNIPVESLTSKGVVVFNTPGANANAVKELVLASMFIATRNLFAAHQSLATLATEDLAKEVERTKKAFKGQELHNKILAVIGLGAIGGMVANNAQELGMKVIGFDNYLTVENALRLSSKVKRANSLLEALKDADFISLHVPYLESTHHLMNEAVFAELKKGAVLLNFAREEVVEEKALISALQSHLANYITDFPTKSLLREKKVIAFPHLGASTKEAEENCAIMAAEQLVCFLKSGEIKNSVNFPELRLDSSANFRLALSNQNCPNMLGQITGALASLEFNIVELSNRSKGDVAYNLIDVDKAPSEELIESLLAIEGVLNCRSITL